MSYPEGDNIINKYTNRTCRVSIDIDFDCDPNAIWTLPNASEPGLAPGPSEFYNVDKDICKVIILKFKIKILLIGKQIFG